MEVRELAVAGCKKSENVQGGDFTWSPEMKMKMK